MLAPGLSCHPPSFRGLSAAAALTAAQNQRAVEALKNELNAVAVGQTAYKDALVNAVLWLRLAHTATAHSKPSVLALGPTGCGKTLLARTAAEVSGLPYAEVSAPDFAPSGVGGGKSVKGIFSELVLQNPDCADLSRGILLIDEVDKLAASGDPDAQKVASARLGVQRELLTVIHGARERVCVNGRIREVDSRGWLVVACGAFQGLDLVTARRARKGGMGFHRPATNDTEGSVELADFVEYGLIPELLGRLPFMVTLNSLTPTDFARILTELPSSPINELKLQLQRLGLELVVKPDAVTALSEAAALLGIGARGLVGVTERCFAADLRRKAPGLVTGGVNRVVVDADTILRGESFRREHGPSLHKPLACLAAIKVEPRPSAAKRRGAPFARPARSQSSAAHGAGRLATAAELRAAMRTTPPSPHLPGVIALGEQASDGSQLVPVWGDLPLPAGVTMVVAKNQLGWKHEDRRPSMLQDHLIGHLLHTSIRSRPASRVLVLDLGYEWFPALQAMTRAHRGVEARRFEPEWPDASFHLNVFAGIKTLREAREKAVLLMGISREGQHDSPYFREGALDVLTAAILMEGIRTQGRATGEGIRNLLVRACSGDEKLKETGRGHPVVAQFLSLARQAAAGNSNAQTTLSTALLKLKPWVLSGPGKPVQEKEHTPGQFAASGSGEVVFIGTTLAAMEECGPLCILAAHSFIKAVVQARDATGSAPLDLFLLGVDRLAVPELNRLLPALRPLARTICLSVASIAAFKRTYAEHVQSDPELSQVDHWLAVPELGQDDGDFLSRLTGHTTVQEIVTSDGATPTQVIPVSRPLLQPGEITQALPHERLGPLMSVKFAGGRPFQFYLRPWRSQPVVGRMLAAGRREKTLELREKEAEEAEASVAHPSRREPLVPAAAAQRTAPTPDRSLA